MKSVTGKRTSRFDRVIEDAKVSMPITVAHFNTGFSAEKNGIQDQKKRTSIDRGFISSQHPRKASEQLPGIFIELRDQTTSMVPVAPLPQSFALVLPSLYSDAPCPPTSHPCSFPTCDPQN